MSEVDIETVDKLIEKLGDLPTAPIILHKAIKLTSDIQSNIDEISKNISADQSLTAKVIRFSNTPYYGRSKKISSLDEAIQVMGFDQVKEIVITASTYQLFQLSSHVEIARTLWEHSLAAAIASRLIVEKFGELDKEEAYLCGLLHDIGKLVMLQIAPYYYEEIINKVKETEQSFLNIEGKELGYNHVHVGRALLSKWLFPSNLIWELSKHHEDKMDKKEHSISLSRVTSIADSIAKYLGFNFFEAYKAENSTVYFVGNRLISEEELISLRNETEEKFNNEMNFYHN